MSNYIENLFTKKRFCTQNFPGNNLHFFNLLTIYYKKDNTMNEQTKHKISMALRGRKKSAVTRKRISQAMKRYRKSEQHKQAIAEAMRTVWQNKNNRLNHF